MHCRTFHSIPSPTHWKPGAPQVTINNVPTLGWEPQRQQYQGRGLLMDQPGERGSSKGGPKDDA